MPKYYYKYFLCGINPIVLYLMRIQSIEELLKWILWLLPALTTPRSLLQGGSREADHFYVGNILLNKVRTNKSADSQLIAV